MLPTAACAARWCRSSTRRRRPFHSTAARSSNRMSGTMRHETLKAGDLRTRYLDRLAQRKDRLAHLARTTGWQFSTHHTDAPATQSLLWLYQSLAQPA